MENNMFPLYIHKDIYFTRLNNAVTPGIKEFEFNTVTLLKVL